jgi:hypothetical protein
MVTMLDGVNHNSNEEISRIKELLAKPSKSISLPRGEKAKLKYLTASNEKWLPIKNIIFDYDIDFTKFGWVHKVAKILEIPDQKVNKWMKRFHPEFLQTCFTRNTKQNS